MTVDFMIHANDHREFEALRSENAPTANMGAGAATTIAEWLTGVPQSGECGTLDPADALGCWPEVEKVAREADAVSGRVVLGSDRGIWVSRVENVREVLEAAYRIGREVYWA